MKLFVAMLLVCASVLTACSKRAPSVESPLPPVSAEALARVGDREITVAEFEQELTRRMRGNPQFYASEEQRRQVLAEMIQFETLLAAARAAGYDRDPRIQSQINQFIVARYQEDQLQRIETIPPTDAELRAFHAAHADRFARPATVRAALIQFKLSPKAAPEKRAELHTKARTIEAMARMGDAAAFGRLAQLHSEDQATRYQRGETGWMSHSAFAERWGAPVADAVFALTEPDQVAPVVETADGFFLVRLLERQSGGVRPLEEVREAVAYAVARQKELDRQTEWQTHLQQSMRVEIYSERLPQSSPAARTSDSAPPRVPNS